jgi:uncharacterized protein (TIGR03435 family)
MDFRSFRQYDLKHMLAELYDTSRIRILLPSSLDDGRQYDFGLVLPEPEGQEAIYGRFRQGIEEHFQVTIERAERLMEVYAVTASGEPAAAAKAGRGSRRGASHSFSRPWSVGFQVMSRAGVPKAVGIGDIRSVKLQGTADEFCRALEGSLDRPIVNETGLSGVFDFHVEASPGIPNDFLERLRDRLHLVITSASRTVPMIIVTPR